MTSFHWREHMCVGGQTVSPSFSSPREAGIWRRDHPPLIDGHGPTLVKLVDGVRTKLDAGEFCEAYFEFAAVREPVA
jgi:hypothetical protein